MDTSSFDLESLATRLENLERQNRWLKRGACAALLLFSSVLVMGQAKPLPDVIEARSFIVKDSDGRPRIELGFRDNSSWINLKNSAGKVMVDMELLGDAVPAVFFRDSQGKQTSALFGDSYTVMGSTPNDFSIYIGPSPINSADKEPRILLHGANGFSAAIGSDDLVTTRTGEQHKTSAASLVLFGKDGKVLWSAP